MKRDSKSIKLLRESTLIEAEELVTKNGIDEKIIQKKF